MSQYEQINHNRVIDLIDLLDLLTEADFDDFILPEPAYRLKVHLSNVAVCAERSVERVGNTAILFRQDEETPLMTAIYEVTAPIDESDKALLVHVVSLMEDDPEFMNILCKMPLFELDVNSELRVQLA